MIWLVDTTQYSRYLMHCRESTTQPHAFGTLISIQINAINPSIPVFRNLY